MSCFEASLEVQAPLQACFSLWIAHDYYPHCQFSEVPTLKTGWSSLDAWGENQLMALKS